MIFVFDRDLASDILATKGLVGREPRGGVAIGFGLVGLGVGGKQIERVGSKGVTFTR